MNADGAVGTSKVRPARPHPERAQLTDQGETDLCELRPRQGRSPTRLLYRRVGDAYIVLAVAKDKTDFEKKKRAAQERGRQHE